jgi:hypothetical protein
VRPSGGCIAFQAQHLSRGRWVTAGTLSCATIQSDHYAYVFSRRESPGTLFRMRAYVGSTPYSLGGTSAWLTFKFV